jgi:hypothetical protein
MVAKALRITEKVDSDFFQPLEKKHREFLMALGTLTKANGGSKPLGITY